MQFMECVCVGQGPRQQLNSLTARRLLWHNGNETGHSNGKQTIEAEAVGEGGSFACAMPAGSRQHAGPTASAALPCHTCGLYSTCEAAAMAARSMRCSAGVAASVAMAVTLSARVASGPEPAGQQVWTTGSNG